MCVPIFSAWRIVQTQPYARTQIAGETSKLEELTFCCLLLI
jgi:hypothetical protein